MNEDKIVTMCSPFFDLLKEETGMIAGIDIGSTSTKVVLLDNGCILCKMRVLASDAVAAAAGALGKLDTEKGYKIQSIDGIAITGAGASKIHQDIFDIPTVKIEEIMAIGHGGKFLSKRDDIIIANIGTGTPFIEVNQNGIAHIGGTGVGGGTIIGLAKALIKTSDFNTIMDLASKGDLSRVDLMIKDIADTDISFLAKDMTASNFAKMLESATREDIAMAIINMVYQVIGMLSVFVAQSRNKDSIIVTGNGNNNAIGRNVLGSISEMYGIHFEFPEDAEFSTAIGAVLAASSA